MYNSKIFIITIIGILSLFSCASTSLKTSEETLMIENKSDLHIELRYISNNEIKRIYGNSGNIFSNFPALITPRKTIVFNLKVQSEKSLLKFRLENFQLQIGDTLGVSKNRNQLINIWEFYLKKDGELDKAKRLSKTKLFKNSEVLEYGNQIQNWIVFSDDYPEQGIGELILNFHDENDELIQYIIPMEFVSEDNSVKLF